MIALGSRTWNSKAGSSSSGRIALFLSNKLGDVFAVCATHVFLPKAAQRKQKIKASWPRNRSKKRLISKEVINIGGNIASDISLAKLEDDVRSKAVNQFNYEPRKIIAVSTPEDGQRLSLYNQNGKLIAGTVLKRKVRLNEKTDLITIKVDRRNYTDDGDSGALWFDPQTNAAVAVHSGRKRGTVYATELAVAVEALGSDYSLVSTNANEVV
ncbi:MAG: hypothetical protein AAFQ36_11230 [Pseudomonadota bacterium]